MIPVPRAFRSIVVALLATGPGAAGITACAPDEQGSGVSSPRTAAVRHVHGLEIDPADGQVRVATHHGLFRLTDGRLEKVGSSATADRDLMGFLVIAPGTYLASGHPSPDEVVTPDPLGLVRSTDRGQSWQSVSLDGAVDFHALDEGPDGIYGVDAEGVLRTSADGTRWDTRPAPPALDIAVEPRAGGRAALAVGGGIAVAEARTRPEGGPFVTTPGPQLVFLSWAPDGELLGLSPDARVFGSADGGATWAARGDVPGGRPQALTAVGAGQVLAATEGGIYDSRDGGRTFSALFGGES